MNTTITTRTRVLLDSVRRPTRNGSQPRGDVGPLGRLAHFTARFRWPVIAAWIVLTLVGGVAAGKLSTRWYQSTAVPGKSAYEGSLRTLKALGVGQRPPNIVVLHSTNVDVTKSPAVRAAMARVVNANPRALTSSYFSTGNAMYVSRDRHTTFLHDYALLMVFRFRDELRDGNDVESALVETMTHAGHSVIVSGTTVAVGLLSMVILPLPLLRGMGIGGMLIPVVSVLASLTLLPAMLAVLGTKVNRVRVMPRRLVDRGHPEDGAWGRWARFVLRRPAAVAAVGVAIVAVLAGLGTQLNPSEAQMKYFPGSGTAITGRDQLAAAGITPGVIKPLNVLVEHGGNAQQIAAKLRAVPGIARASAPPEWRRGQSSFVEAFATTDGAAPVSQML